MPAPPARRPRPLRRAWWVGKGVECAIPARITEFKEGNIATVDILGVTRQISVDLTPQAMLDDYVLVHAGFAIASIG